MSKNHPHDNIYSILGKLNALQPTTQQKHDAKVQQIRESVEAQGSILSGVDSVQAKLAKAFAESNFNQTSKAIQKSGKSKESADAIAATIGRNKLGQKEMTRRSVAGRKNESEFDEGVVDKVRAANYDRLSKRSHDQANVNKDRPDLVPAYNVAKMKKGDDRAAKAAELRRQNECAMCEAGTCSEHTMEEGELSFPEKGVTRHTKTDFPGYPADDYADDETERTAKKGRPRKAQTVKPRVDPNAPKKGRGRPKAEKPGFQGGIASMNDPFGRSPSKAPKSKIKGHVHTMGEAMDTLSQRFARIVEGVNFRTMAEETNQTIDELMMELQQDINNYKTTGHCSDKLKDFLQVHSHAKKQMADEAVNPNNPFYKKQNDYDLPPSLRGHGTADYKLPDVKAHDNVERDNYRDRAGLNPLHDELNELARLAGIADEGNAFTGKLKATDHGDDFELDGKTFTDNSTLDEEPNEGNEFSGELVKARAQHRDSFDVDGKEYPVKEADAPVATKGANPVNAPKEKYYSMKASTLNPGEGDNGEKAMHGDKPTFKNGDNPLSKTAITPVREATLSLEARLAAEYESIKKVTK